MSEIADKVKNIIAEHLGIDDLGKLTDDAKFIDDLGADRNLLYLRGFFQLQNSF